MTKTETIDTLELPDNWSLKVKAKYDGEDWYPQITLENNRGMKIPISATLSTPHQIGAFLIKCSQKINSLYGVEQESESKKYEGYSWIKVKRAVVEPAGDVPPWHKVVRESHHVEETTFLIEEIKKLAAKIDLLESKT